MLFEKALVENRYYTALFIALCLHPTPATAQDCGLYQYRAVITDVYDGDTVTADIDLGFNTWRHGERLRLYGIDTPEIRTRDDAEKAAGFAARDKLRELILDKEVTLCTLQDEEGKFGRMLAKLYLDDGGPVRYVNAWLVLNGYAEVYE